MSNSFRCFSRNPFYILDHRVPPTKSIHQKEIIILDQLYCSNKRTHGLKTSETCQVIRHGNLAWPQSFTPCVASTVLSIVSYRSLPLRKSASVKISGDDEVFYLIRFLWADRESTDRMKWKMLLLRPSFSNTQIVVTLTPGKREESLDKGLGVQFNFLASEHSSDFLFFYDRFSGVRHNVSFFFDKFIKIL